VVPGRASEIICTFVATRFWLVAALGANQACAGCDLACADARGRERMQGGQVEPGWRKERLRFRGFERLTFRRTGEFVPGRRSALCTTEHSSVLPHFQLGNQSEFCATTLRRWDTPRSHRELERRATDWNLRNSLLNHCFSLFSKRVLRRHGR